MTALSAVEFLIWLLMAASAIALLARRLHVPYTVALVAGGLILSTLRLKMPAPWLSEQRPDWLTADVILILFLPALIFEGSIKINLRDLAKGLVSVGAACGPGGGSRDRGYRVPRPLAARPAPADRADLRGHHLRHRSHFSAGPF